ncbi:MAG: CDP-glycerol glycerophosphotransferase family protein, partial [Clostridia bacterium]|nr:CDP-glycerol glycerophosphotransferase family protein [Clostridia bacterium]
MEKPFETNKKTLRERFYQSMFFDEFIKRDLFTNKGLLLGETKKVWAFNSGNTFTGNPKWLFIYINKYRKDIDAYWLCDNVETVDYVRSLGYKAYAFNAGGGIEVKNRAGVFVTEQVKEQIPTGMENAILLNLYHGVGCKTIERKVDSGFLVDRIMTKYIRHSNYYFNNMLFLVTSPLMEEHFMNQVGVDKDHVIRAGYPRCTYQQNYSKIATFNHNIIDKKKKNKDTRVVVYAPTYRDNAGVDLMNSAIPDMDALEKKLKKNNMLLIFKMHPFVVSDINYQNIMQKYKNSPYFLFWDNNNDFYEVMDKVDIAVVDYSSIFYDLLAAGVKNYVRYFFDYDNPDNLRDFAFDCKEMTCGKICNNFEEFLAVFDNIESTDSEEADRQRIYDLFWQYSDKDTFEKIINQTLEFEPEKKDAPTLYSFDIFDTIISRKGLHPHSIFYKIKEQLEKSDMVFPAHFIENFVEIRIKSEQNAREYYNKTM